MGREFLDVFEEWAEYYDESVSGHDIQYAEAFRRYDEILQTVAEKSGTSVLEFGVGTGNLTKKLFDLQKQVYGIEPSKAMLDIAVRKLDNSIHIEEGDFLHFFIDTQIDTIVSTYAFHHLTDEEKYLAIEKYRQLLPTHGKIIFADTMFKDKQSFQEAIQEAEEMGYRDLAEDLRREYYTTVPILQEIFYANGFRTNFTQMNLFVWIVEAIKDKEG